MPINDRMPEKYRSMFRPVKQIIDQWQRIEKFQEKQHQLNSQLMRQQYERASKLIEQIKPDAVRANQIEQFYSERVQKLKLLLSKQMRYK